MLKPKTLAEKLEDINRMHDQYLEKLVSLHEQKIALIKRYQADSVGQSLKKIRASLKDN